MTAFYGSHYFGVDNIECRCATCEEYVIECSAMIPSKLTDVL